MTCIRNVKCAHFLFSSSFGFPTTGLNLSDEYGGRDEGDSKNALLEVRSGSGGDEAAAFAKEIFEMYRRFAELKGWKFDGMTCSSIDAGKRGRDTQTVREEGGNRWWACVFVACLTLTHLTIDHVRRRTVLTPTRVTTNF